MGFRYDTVMTKNKWVESVQPHVPVPLRLWVTFSIIQVCLFSLSLTNSTFPFFFWTFLHLDFLLPTEHIHVCLEVYFLYCTLNNTYKFFLQYIKIVILFGDSKNPSLTNQTQAKITSAWQSWKTCREPSHKLTKGPTAGSHLFANQTQGASHPHICRGAASGSVHPATLMWFLSAFWWHLTVTAHRTMFIQKQAWAGADCIKSGLHRLFRLQIVQTILDNEELFILVV